MLSNELVDISVKVSDDETACLGSKIKVELEFSNKTDRDLHFKDVIINYECHCSINLFHLKRFHKKNDVEKILTNYNQRYIISSTSISTFLDKYDFVILKTEFILFESKVICANKNFKIPIKIKIPEESIISYESKYIHFYNVIRTKANFLNSDLNTKDIVVPIYVQKYSPKEPNQSAENDAEDLPLYNPFDFRENYSDESFESDFSKLFIDNQSATRYKITYKNSDLCYLSSVKPYLSIGDDIRLILNFAPESAIRCIKFSVTLKALEHILIPHDNSNTNEDSFQLCLSTKEFGPFFHESVCIDVYPLMIRIPDDQQPSLNFEMFKYDWVLYFKFMIADTKEVTIDLSAPPSKEPVSWTFKNNLKTELLKWELPITVQPQKILELS